jgi:SSS family solute:Na+ symporter/sodium/pantothenate symporter
MAWMPFVTTGVVFLIGIIGIQAFPGLDKMGSEKLVGMLANAIAGSSPLMYWLMVLLFAGVVAAIISTADSVLLTFSSMISKDIYGRFINPGASEQRKLYVGKLTGVFAVFVLLFIAWNPPGTLYEIFVLKFEVLIQVAPAFIIGLYWKRMAKGPVLIGMLAGALTAAVLTFTGNKALLGIYSGIWGLLVNLTIAVAGSLFISTAEDEEARASNVMSVAD